MFFAHRFIFWLSVALQAVDALNGAAPYEMVYLYDAYKMEYLTVPAGARKIAPGCTHTPFTGNAASPLGQINANINAVALAEGVVGICTFNEFMQHIQTNAWRIAMQGKEVPRGGPNNLASINDPLTRTLNPNADRLAAAVNDIATIGENRLLTRPDRLFSTADLTLMGGTAPEWNVPWSTQLRKASDVVETARKEMANRLRLDPTNVALQATVARFQTWVDRAILNLGAVHKFRTGDFSRFLVPSMQTHISWTSSPISAYPRINNEPYVRADGTPSQLIRYTPAGLVTDTTYQVIDYETSFADARVAGNPVSFLQKRALKNAVAAYGTIAGSIEKAHRDILDTVKFARDLHRKPITPSFLDSLGGCSSCCIVM